MGVAILAVSGVNARAQASYAPPNDLPNPYRTVTQLGAIARREEMGIDLGVSVGPDGNIWTYDRCGAKQLHGLEACADPRV